MMVDIWPPVIARIDVGKAKQRTGVAGFEIDHLAPVTPAAQIGGQGSAASNLGIESETANLASAARHF